VRYRLVGGPADGELSIDFTVRPFVGYTIDRATHAYEFRTDGRFHDVGLAEVFQENQEPVAVHATRGWHDLQLSVNRRLPTALSKARRLRIATRRSIARRTRR
jgi:hypothetical protein